MITQQQTCCIHFYNKTKSGLQPFVCKGTPCPTGSGDSPPGATELSQCKAKPGYYNTGTQVGACPVGSQSPPGATSLSDCKAKPGYYNTGTEVIACPNTATSVPAATELSQCTCDSRHYDSDTAILTVTCAACTASCGANEYEATKCGAVDVYHGLSIPPPQNTL